MGFIHYFKMPIITCPICECLLLIDQNGNVTLLHDPETGSVDLDDPNEVTDTEPDTDGEQSDFENNE